MRVSSVISLVLLSLAASRGRNVEDDGDRIVGGDEVEAHSIPWQVGILYKNSDFHFCGGTILSATKILTAAHCQKDPSGIEVIVGEHSKLTATDGVRHAVTSFEIHPDYDSSNYDNDFGIITLEVPIELGDKAAAACLPEPTDTIADGQVLTVSGWGTTSSGGSSSDVLLAVQVPYVTNEKCQTQYTWEITSNMMCAGNYDEGGVDACQGDSGGPLTMHNKVMGVVSWGKGCALEGYPGVYARVTAQLAWIMSQGEFANEGCEGEDGGPITDAPSTEEPTTDEPSTEEPTTDEPEEPEVPAHPDPTTCNMAWVGDGICDARNNHAGCFFDGNDCCDPTEGYMKFCHRKVAGCKCNKKAFKKCSNVEWAADWYCDDENNTPECNYDGGDCCTRKFDEWDDWCEDCQCIFPGSSGANDTKWY